MKPARDRGWFGIAALVLAAAGLAWLAAREFLSRESRTPGERGSIFTAEASGSRALYLLLKAEGLQAEALTRPPTGVMEPGLLVVVDPISLLSHDQAEEVRDWVDKGGALLVLGESFGALSDVFSVKAISPTKFGLGLALPGSDQPALALATGSDASIHGPAALEVLASRGSGAQAVELVMGKGSAVFVSDAWIATNAGLDAADNAAWLVATAKRLAGNRPVMFLETIHGHLREPSVPEYLRDRGLGPVALQVLLVLFAGLWFAGARPAPPLAPSTLVRRPVAEHAATMAHLYSRGRAEHHAVTVAMEDLEAWLRRSSWSRGLARLTPAERVVAEKEVEDLRVAGKWLTAIARPNEAAAHDWIARAARFRGRFRSDDRD